MEVVAIAGNYAFSVRSKNNARDEMFVSLECENLLAGRSVPESDAFIADATRNPSGLKATLRTTPV